MISDLFRVFINEKMTACSAVAFMLVASWQLGMGSTEAPFSEKEVVLEKAIAGSGSYGGVCCQQRFLDCPHPIGLIFADSKWKSGQTYFD